MIICGTGHRPNKLGGYDEETSVHLHNLAFDWLVANEPELVISGGALGWDQALAAAARSAKIPFALALPFPGFEDRWPTKSKEYLYGLMQSVLCQETVFVCPEGYAGWKMQKRNEYMVDRADKVLALWDGSTGGTGNCINYANKVKKPIENLWEEYIKNDSREG